MPRAQKGTGQHPCPLCDKWFTRAGDVGRHITGMHSRERPYLCARYPHACNFTASQKCNRKAHYKSHPDCAKEAEILERIQELAPVKSAKAKSRPTIGASLATPVSTKKPQKRTRASASQVAPYPSRGPLPSESPLSGFSGAEQPIHEVSLSNHHVQLNLPQYAQQQEQADITFDWELLSSPQTQLDLSFQTIASQQWDQQQFGCFPTYSDDQLLQNTYMTEFFSLPESADFSTVFDDPALQNLLPGVQATGNISAPLALHVTQPGHALENFFDFTISADDQADLERMIHENPPSPSVLNSLPLIDGQTYPSIWAMPDLQSFSCFVS